jgi:hypothetical protein
MAEDSLFLLLSSISLSLSVCVWLTPKFDPIQKKKMTKDEDFEIEKNRSHYKKRRNYQSNSAAHFNVSRQNIHPRRQHQRYYNVCTTYLVIKSAKFFFFFNCPVIRSAFVNYKRVQSPFKISTNCGT